MTGDRRLRLASYVLALVGLASASYLTYTKFADDGQCHVSAGCTVLQTGEWSEIFGISVSLLGVIGYLVVIAALSIRGELARLSLVLFTGIGFLFSCYLMYRAYITVDVFCPFCTTSAICMTALAIISTVRFVRGPGLPPTPAWDPDDVEAPGEDADDASSEHDDDGEATAGGRTA
ncbi:MAG: vitamin K epoxide reductase family protein [Solirubrobacteraceae bacterium]|nr:vitamin K epoxide reductase family protein [Solirubrobacteraceae bacterium]